MPLTKNIVDIPLTGGLDEGKGAIYVEPPAWTLLDNVRFTERGYMKQRPGYVPGVRATAFYAKRNGTPVSRGLTSIASYLENEGVWADSAGLGGVGLAPVVAMDVSTRVAANAYKSPVACDFARSASSGVEMFAWIDGGLIYAAFRDQYGNPIGAPRNLTASGAAFTSADSSDLRACCVGTTFAVFAASDANVLYGWTGSAVSGVVSWSSSTTVKAATGAPFDADSNDDDDEFIVAYWNGSATVIERLNTSLASQGTATIASSTGANVVGVKYDSGRILAMYSTTTGGLYCASYSDDLGTTHFGHTSLGTSASMNMSPSAALSGSTWHVTWNQVTQTYNTITTSGAAGTALSSYGPFHAGAIFVHNNVVYIPSLLYGLSNDNLQPAGALLALRGSGSNRSLVPVARFLSDRMSAAVSRSRVIRTENTAAQSHAVFAMAALESLAPFSASATAISSAPSAITRVAFSFPGGASSFAEFDGNTYFGGGQLWGFDGVHAWESSPHMFPEDLSVSLAGSAGFLSAGAYAWKAVYEWEDANGVLHRSAPSPSASDTASSTNTATVKVPKLWATMRDGVAQVEHWISLYRTTVGGSVFYMCGRWPISSLSSTTLGYWDVNDGVADSGLGEILYTEGGVLEATAPPPAWDLCIAGGRMWIVSADRRNELWYSKKLSRGIAPEFNAAQVIDVPDDVMCVRGMDDKVIAFGASGIFAIYGEGPNDTGNGGTFTEPQRLTSLTGCLSRETVDVGDGIIFGGDRGAYLLDRGLGVKWISEPVSDSLGGAFRGAAKLASNNEAIFNTGSHLIVLNLDTGQWARWSLPTTSTGNAWHIMTNDGPGTSERLYIAQRSDAAIASPTDTYDTAPSTDATIGWEARTGYIRPASTNARQRIWKLVFQYYKDGVADLRISLGSEDDALTTFRTYTSAELDTAAGRLEIHLPSQYQRAHGLRVGFLVVSSGAGQYGTIQLQSLTAVIGVRQGTRSLPSTSRG